MNNTCWIDFHTHLDREQTFVPPEQRVLKIISLPLQEAASALPENTLATLELHPWNGETFSDKFVQLAQEKTFIGIGEAGLDRLRGKLPLSDQIEIFEQVVNLAETLQKPLTIHCVKCFSELLQLYKKLTWQVPTVIHYYRGNLELAQQLWRDTHFYLSLPPAVYTQKKLLEFLQNSPQYLKRIMLETDDPAGDIVKHFYTMSELLAMEPEVLKQVMQQNFEDFYHAGIF